MNHPYAQRGSTLEPPGFTDALRHYAPDALVFGHIHGNGRVLEVLDDISIHFVAADALGFRPKLILDVSR